MKKEEKNTENNSFSKEMGLTQEEMNQIVGGTTFTGGSEFGGPVELDVCQNGCLICKNMSTTISICSKGCKSKSQKLTDEFTD